MSNTPWEDIVRAARELDQSFARGGQPDSVLVGDLARAVLAFQQHLLAMRQAPLKAPSVQRTEPPGDPDDGASTAA